MNNDEAEQFIDQHALRAQSDQPNNSPNEWETLRKAKLKDEDCRRFNDLVDDSHSELKEQDGILCRTSPIDGCVKAVSYTHLTLPTTSRV